MDNIALKKILKTAKIRQCELAKASANLTPSRISTILSGWEKPGPETIERLKHGLIKLGLKESQIRKILLDSHT